MQKVMKFYLPWMNEILNLTKNFEISHGSDVHVELSHVAEVRIATK